MFVRNEDLPYDFETAKPSAAQVQGWADSSLG